MPIEDDPAAPSAPDPNPGLHSGPAAEPPEEEEEEEEEDERSCCDRCGARIEEYDGTMVSYEIYCDSCIERVAFHCYDCEEWHENQEHNERCGRDLCDNCCQSYSSCDRCGAWYHQDDNPECGCGDSPILSYIDRTANKLGPFGVGPVWYGVELELEAGTDRNADARASEVLDRGEGMVVCKEDSSIGCGFEIVTARCDLDNHRRLWRRILSPGLTGCKSWDTTTCGLHVHVSRAPLSHLQIGKILVFVNDENNKDLIVGLAGRDEQHYAARTYKSLSSSVRRKDTWAGGYASLATQIPGPEGLEPASSSRYEAVNLDNSHTIEFRIFKGSLKLDTVLRAVEFVDAVIAFTAPGVTGNKALTARHFASFVERGLKRWPLLLTWLRDHNYLTPAKRDIRKPPLTERPRPEV